MTSSHTLIRLLAVCLVLAFPAVGSAVVLGGGLADADCRIGFSGVDATAGAIGVVCVDGDPACDADATADGQCTFAVSLCAHLDVAGCEQSGLTALTIAGLPFAAPLLETDTQTCGAPLDVAVPVGTAAGATVIARERGNLRDVDYANLCCRSSAGPLAAAACAAQVDLAVAGCEGGAVPRALEKAFDRAQRLIETAGDGVRKARRARRPLTRARRLAKRVGEDHPCGNTLGLVVGHAQSTLADAIAGR